MTSTEFDRMSEGFRENALGYGTTPEEGRRYGFVALHEAAFVGCSSGLAHRVQDRYLPWFYLTDLFVELPFRRRGLGGRLLGALERRVRTLGIRRVWLWTAEFEAPAFYKAQGYTVRCELEGFYATGHSRIMMVKDLDSAE